MKCPSCGSLRVYPSRLRGLLDRLRQEMTGRQPYRCHECGWRRWQPMQTHEEGPEAGPDDLRTGREASPVTPSDLDRLDPQTPRP